MTTYNDKPLLYLEMEDAYTIEICWWCVNICNYYSLEINNYIGYF